MTPTPSHHTQHLTAEAQLALGRQVSALVNAPGLTDDQRAEVWSSVTDDQLRAYYRLLDQEARDYHLERFGAVSCRRWFGTDAPPPQATTTLTARPREGRTTRRAARSTAGPGDPDPEPDPP